MLTCLQKNTFFAKIRQEFLYPDTRSLSDNNQSMNPAFSLYLDALRFLAAIAVYLSHIASSPFTQNVIWWRLSLYGDVAVIIFFILSGYVISYVTSSRERCAKDYFSARAARLYSVVGIGLLLTFMLDSAGIWLNPDFYTIQKILWKPESLAGYLSSLFFVNEFQIFGFNGIAPGTNGPYWSLSFEATYYVIAGLFLFAKPQLSIPTTLIILMIAGKTIAALLPVWVIGFMLYRIKPLAISAKLSAYLGIASAFVILAAPTISAHLPSSNLLISLPWGRSPFNRNLVEDYLVTIAFATHLVCVRQLLQKPISITLQLRNAIRWLGTLTFPLYCFHYPIICFLAAVSPWENTTISDLLFICFFSVVLIVALTPICEQLKRLIRLKIST